MSKGYDPDYIWKQVDRGPVKDAASYYIQASETGGAPPGRWWGPGARALALEPGQTVERKPYDLLFGKRQAPDGTPLGKPPDRGRKAADLYARLLAAEPHAANGDLLRIEAITTRGLVVSRALDADRPPGDGGGPTVLSCTQITEILVPTVARDPPFGAPIMRRAPARRTARERLICLR